MTAGVLGKKIGMTQIFTQQADVLPATVIEAGPCVILEVKDLKDKKIVKLGFDDVPEKSVKRPDLGNFKKLKTNPKRFVRSIQTATAENVKAGQEIKIDIFQEGGFVDITGVSIGKGFQGGVKRWGWAGGPKSHGSMSHRRIGSVGASADPSRVFKGQHMPGHMGNKKVTTQNLKILKIYSDKNIMLVKGAVPGHKNSYLVIKKSKKRQTEAVGAAEDTKEQKQEKKDAKKKE